MTRSDRPACRVTERARLGRLRGAALLAGVLLLAGCNDAGGRGLQDDAACPGPTCTDDAQAVLSAVEDVDGVVSVEKVSRQYGADRGSHRSADVTTDASGRPGVRQVGLAVMAQLEDWPGHADGPATVRLSAPSGDVHLRMEDEWVCEVVDRTIKPCGPANSWLVTGEKVS